MKNMIIDSIGNIDNEMVESVATLRQKKTNRYAWTKWVAVAACICIVATMANAFGLGVYAKSLLQSFGLYAGTSQIELGQMIPIDLDVERFKNMPNVQVVKNSDVEDNDLYVLCEDAEELQTYSGIVLPSNGEIAFTDITFNLSGKYRNGHLSMLIVDGNGDTVAIMNGQFILEGNKDTEPMGYGYSQGKVKSIYTCDNGTKAYIIKLNEKELKDVQMAVFVADGIQYQLVVDNTEKGTAIAKSIVDLMCN